MRGSFTQHLIRSSALSPAVERTKAIAAEAAEVRLAKAFNQIPPAPKGVLPRRPRG